MFGGGGEPPRPPNRPLPPPPSPSPPPRPERWREPPTIPPRQATLTTEELAQTVARVVTETLARVQQPALGQTPAPAAATSVPEPARINVSRLKMANPEAFDGSPTTSFNTWWRSVTKYLGFYPETGDRQKIAWVGLLLTGTAKAWDLHRYDTLGEADTWFNYSSAIRTEYMDTRVAANTQIKLGQLRYTDDI